MRVDINQPNTEIYTYILKHMSLMIIKLQKKYHGETEVKWARSNSGSEKIFPQ